MGVLAVSSPVMRRYLADATIESEEPALILMVDFTSREVENLLNLLYSGICRHTDDLTLMLNILKINKRHLISEKPTVKVQSDVKVETHEVFEDEDSFFYGGFDDVGPTSDNDMTGFKESDQSSEDNWKPSGVSVKEQKVVEKKKKR